MVKKEEFHACCHLEIAVLVRGVGGMKKLTCATFLKAHPHAQSYLETCLHSSYSGLKLAKQGDGVEEFIVKPNLQLPVQFHA